MAIGDPRVFTGDEVIHPDEYAKRRNAVNAEFGGSTDHRYDPKTKKIKTTSKATQPRVFIDNGFDF